MIRLPPELIARIELHLFQGTREQHRSAWELEFCCYEDECLDMDHFSWHEKVLICSQNGIKGLRTRYTNTGYGMESTLELPEGEQLLLPPELRRKEAVEARFWELYGSARDLFERKCEVHLERCEAWERRTHGSSSFFKKHEDFVAKHFGVRIWSSNFRFPYESWRHDVGTAEATFTYLTMPANRIRSERWRAK